MRKKIKDICQIYSGGDKPNAFSLQKTSEHPFPVFANATENDGLLGFTDSFRIQGDTITVSARGSGCGFVFYRETPYYPVVRLLSLVPDTKQIYPKYLYYLLKTKQLRSFGSGQPQITIPQIGEMVIDYDENIENQKIIADTLWIFDQKEKVLKEMNNSLRQAICDYYFKSFGTKPRNGHISDIIVEEGKSKTQVGEMRNVDGVYPFFTSGDDILSSNRYLVSGSHVFMNTGGNPDVKFYDGKCDYSTDTWCIKANNGMTDYLYLYLLSIKESMETKFYKGTGLKHLQKNALKSETIYIPSESELTEFNSFVHPLLQKISLNYRQIKEINKTKEILLPLLMSGRVIVK